MAELALYHQTWAFRQLFYNLNAVCAADFQKLQGGLDGGGELSAGTYLFFTAPFADWYLKLEFDRMAALTVILSLVLLAVCLCLQKKLD